MIPIIFGPNETDFTSNGLGRLHCTSCKVHEVLNGEFELEASFDYFNNKYAKDIVNDNILLVTTEYGEETQPFQIYEVEKNEDGEVNVSAEHISYRLNHIPVVPIEHAIKAKTPSEAFSDIQLYAAEKVPFSFYTDVTATGDMTIESPISAKEMMGDDDETGILGVFKSGEYKYDRFKVSLLKRRGRDTSINLRYGDNIKTMKQTENTEDVVTGVVPYWKGTENDQSVIVRIPNVVYYAANADAYPYHKTTIVDVSRMFDDKPTSQSLLEFVQKRLANTTFGEPDFKITIDFENFPESSQYEDLHASFQKLKMGDMLHVYFPDLDITATGEVTEIEWDVLEDCYSKITIGNASKGIADTIRNLAEANALKEANKLATRLTKDNDNKKITTMSGQIRVIIQGNSTRLISNLQLDAIFGLKPNTSNSSNTSVTFINSDRNGNAYFTNYYYGGDGWYGISSSSGVETYLNYTAQYFGG